MAEKIKLSKVIKSAWSATTSRTLQLFGGLIMEQKGDKWIVSIGRVSWWLAFIPALYIWIAGGGLLENGNSAQDISPNHLTVLITLAGYNLGKKVSSTVAKVFGKSDGPG